MGRLGDASPVDSHVHVWDRSRLRFEWLDELPELSGSKLPEAYDAQRGEVGAAVFVQAGAVPADALVEARWVQSLAPSWPVLAGIVADADLLGGSRVLGAHLDLLEQLDLYRGVRHLLQDLDRDALISDTLAGGLGVLARREVSFDACVRWWQLDDLAGVLERAAPLPVVLDHVGKPPMALGERSDAWAGWERGLRRLGALPGVHVKLSGLSAEAADDRRGSGVPGEAPAATFIARAGRVISTALEIFGADRVMFGSDWPVSAVGHTGLTTADWLDVVRTTLSAAEWDEVAAGTAARVYRLAR